MLLTLGLGVVAAALVGWVEGWHDDALKLSPATQQLFGQGVQIANINHAATTHQANVVANHSTDNTSKPNESTPAIDMNQAIAALQARVAQVPNDVQAWVLLGRSLASLGRFAESAQALQTALPLARALNDNASGNPNQQLLTDVPNVLGANPSELLINLLADLADVTALTQNKVLTGKPMVYVEEALKRNPSHEKALALAATEAEQAGKGKAAAAYWERLRLAVASSPEQSKQQPKQQPKQKQSSGDAPFNLAVQVVLADSSAKPSHTLANASGPNAALFVFIKDTPGPGMPMAALRVPASTINQPEVKLELNNTHWLGPLPNSLPERIYVQARLVATGTVNVNSQADAAFSDWESEWVTLKLSPEFKGRLDKPLLLKPVRQVQP